MNNAYSIVYSPKAKNDLKEIYSYIAFSLMVPDTAKNQVNRIRKGIRLLDFMPSRHSIVDWEPWKSMGMYKLSVDNFSIFYTVDTNIHTVTIIRIVYAKRNISNILKDDRN